MNKIAIFNRYNIETLEQEVNIWLEKHSEVEIVKIDFIPAGATTTCNSIFIQYKEEMI